MYLQHLTVDLVIDIDDTFFSKSSFNVFSVSQDNISTGDNTDCEQQMCMSTSIIPDNVSTTVITETSSAKCARNHVLKEPKKGFFSKVNVFLNRFILAKL